MYQDIVVATTSCSYGGAKCIQGGNLTNVNSCANNAQFEWSTSTCVYTDITSVAFTTSTPSTTSIVSFPQYYIDTFVLAVGFFLFLFGMKVWKSLVRDL